MTRPFAVQYTQNAGGGAVEVTRTLEEALACVRERVESLPSIWSLYEIRHDDGRRWYWEMQGRHGVIKVDNPPKAN